MTSPSHSRLKKHFFKTNPSRTGTPRHFSQTRICARVYYPCGYFFPGTCSVFRLFRRISNHCRTNLHGWRFSTPFYRHNLSWTVKGGETLWIDSANASPTGLFLHITSVLFWRPVGWRWTFIEFGKFLMTNSPQSTMKYTCYDYGGTLQNCWHLLRQK